MTTANLTQKRPRTTAIGSLPHHNIDAALDYSFRLGIPFLPQIPIRNPWEFMIAQALEGLPGLELGEDGSVSLNPDIWMSRTHAFQNRLNKAFQDHSQTTEFIEAFEPSSATSGGWQAFVWELAERGERLAKIQIAGPLTCQWALTLRDGTSVEKYPDLSTQIFRLVLARALAMTRRLQAVGTQPILFLDEPGLYGLTLTNPKHVLGFQELKILIQTLKKEGALIGLHCCSNTDWASVLSFPLDFLSIDVALSLEAALSAEGGRPMESFIRSGGKLSLGIVPTGRSSVLHSVEPKHLASHLGEILAGGFRGRPEIAQKLLNEALYTPACGLALQSVGDAELVLEILNEFCRLDLARIG